MMIAALEEDDDLFDIQYIQMQQNSLELGGSVYSLTSGSLPPHIRSVSPKAEVDISMVTREQTKPTRCSPRMVYITLVAIFVISSSVAIAVAVHEIRVIKSSGHLQGYIQLQAVRTTTGAPDITASPIKKDKETSTVQIPRPPDINNEPTDQRTSCYRNCTMYGDEKFDSQCITGYCVCRGRYYQTESCLPSVNGCIIRKQLQSQYVSLWNAPTRSYTCTTKQTRPETTDDDPKIYVVSIYGNHFETSTRVNLRNSSTTNNIVVLASHYPIRWELDVNHFPVSHIVLLSDRELSSSQANIFHAYNNIIPEIKRIYTPVGYGDDRHSHTVEMLQEIAKSVGTVTKFLGTDFADHIVLDMSN